MEKAIGHYPAEHKRSASLPLLHLWQEHFGYISDEAINWIAAKLELEPINILELVTFYPMFRQAPAGRKHIRVCRTLSCAMAGAYPLMEKLAGLTKIDRRPSGHRDAQSGLGQRRWRIQHRVRGMPRQLRDRAGLHGRRHICTKMWSQKSCAIPNPCPHSASRIPSSGSHPLERRLIFKNIGRDGYTTDIDCYLRERRLRAAQGRDQNDAGARSSNEVKNSGLRGRGGAGFPCGVKWSFIKPDEQKPVYLICNADESEPGTFKDRYIIHQDPHQLIEGMMISCFAINVHTAYIYIRGEFPEGAKILERAIEEARGEKFPRQEHARHRIRRARSTSTAAPAPTSAAKKPA